MKAKASWDSIWDNIYQNQEWGKYPSENLIQFVSRNYYKLDRPKINLLEIGCGPGANIWFMAREGFKVTGIDGSETAIKIAKEKLRKDALDAQLVVGDIVSMPFKDQEFDGIVDNECLYANNEQNSILILSEISRLLKDGGLFYSRTFSNEMFIAQNRNENNFEFSNINEGPLCGKGFVRLIDEQKISELYGRFFKILSIDKLEYTQYNDSYKISEFIIVCQKK